MVVPVFVRKLGGDALHLSGQTVIRGGNVITLFQRRRYRILMLGMVIPKVWAAGLFVPARV